MQINSFSRIKFSVVIDIPNVNIRQAVAHKKLLEVLEVCYRSKIGYSNDGGYPNESCLPCNLEFSFPFKRWMSRSRKRQCWPSTLALFQVSSDWVYFFCANLPLYHSKLTNIIYHNILFKLIFTGNRQWFITIKK